MLRILESKGNSIKEYKKGTKITVYDKMQKGYTYVLEENPGKGFHPEFKPVYTPGEILEMGAFEGKYMNDCVLEFPKEYVRNATTTTKGFFYVENENGLKSNILNINYEM